jgi:hypothetical protein
LRNLDCVSLHEGLLLVLVELLEVLRFVFLARKAQVHLFINSLYRLKALTKRHIRTERVDLRELRGLDYFGMRGCPLRRPEIAVRDHIPTALRRFILVSFIYILNPKQIELLLRWALVVRLRNNLFVVFCVDLLV